MKLGSNGVSVTGANVRLRPVRGSNLWELTAFAEHRLHAVERVSAAFKTLETHHGPYLTLIDPPVPPLNPVRPNRIAAGAAIVFSLLMLIAPGRMLLRSRRESHASSNSPEAVRSQRHRDIIDLCIVFFIFVSVPTAARLVRDRNLRSADPDRTARQVESAPPAIDSDALRKTR